MKNIDESNSPSGFVGSKHPPEAIHGFPKIVGGCLYTSPLPLVYEVHAGFHPVWVHWLDIS
jgi:hypothetical protein